MIENAKVSNYFYPSLTTNAQGAPEAVLLGNKLYGTTHHMKNFYNCMLYKSDGKDNVEMILTKKM
jgi:hypothetical protein